MNIPEGVAEVIHTDPAALMMTTVYGFGSNVGYGHAFGLGVPKTFVGMFILKWLNYILTYKRLATYVLLYLNANQ